MKGMAQVRLLHLVIEEVSVQGKLTRIEIIEIVCTVIHVLVLIGHIAFECWWF
jgi:hypothetical protein